MLNLADLLWIPLVGLGYWYWVGSQKIKEHALLITRRHCRDIGVQLLDATIARHRIWLKRDNEGRLRVWRSYTFEFSSTGNDRYHDQTNTLGQQVISVQLEPHRFPARPDHPDSGPG